jgi:hypothetical protein
MADGAGPSLFERIRCIASWARDRQMSVEIDQSWGNEAAIQHARCTRDWAERDLSVNDKEISRDAVWQHDSAEMERRIRSLDHQMLLRRRGDRIAARR